MTKVVITDYVTSPDIERSILGDHLSSEYSATTEVVLVWHEQIDKAFLAQVPNLKAVVRYGVGFDNIDLMSCKERGVKVCNTPDYGTDEVSDTALAFLLNMCRGISQYDRACRNYQNSWQENTISRIKRNNEIKVAAIGAGRIGSAFLLKSRQLQFQTAFFDPFVSRGYEKVLTAKRFDNLNEILNWADVVSLHLPLNSETFGLINPDFINQLKPGAMLINTARGALLSALDDLYLPLRDGHLAAVALDVLPQEPPVPGKLINAWRKDEEWLQGRLLINPHSAYFSSTSYYEMRSKAALNAKRIVDGLEPYNIISN